MREEFVVQIEGHPKIGWLTKAGTRAMDEAADQIPEVLIHENYLSQKDIGICFAFDFSSLTQQPEFEDMRKLHDELKTEFGADDEHIASHETATAAGVARRC